MWPEIKDWSDPINHLRLEENVNKLSMSEWAWFHPSCYKLINLGTFPIFAVMFLAVAVTITWKFSWWFGIMPFGISIYSLIKGGQRFKERDQIESITFYDLYLRE